MPFKLGHPQLLFLEALQLIADITTITNKKSRIIFGFFINGLFIHIQTNNVYSKNIFYFHANLVSKLQNFI